MNRNLDGISKFEGMAVFTTTTAPTYSTTGTSANRAIDVSQWDEACFFAMSGPGKSTTTTEMTFTATLQHSDTTVDGDFEDVYPDGSTTACKLTGTITTSSAMYTAIGTIKCNVFKKYVRVVPTVASAAANFNFLVFGCVLTEPRNTDQAQTGQFRAANIDDGVNV